MIPVLHALLLPMLLLASLSSGRAVHIVNAPPLPGGLLLARNRARDIISTLRSSRTYEDIHVVVAPGRHYLQEPLVLGPRDSGEAGRFKVVWKGAAGPAEAPNATVFDGGVSIPGPWDPVSDFRGLKLWSAPLPAALQERSVRQLYVNSARYRRTRASAASLNISTSAKQVAGGFELGSAAPLSWLDPTSVELVSDHTWVQHRCPVASITALPLPPPPMPPPGPPPAPTCVWGSGATGRSPGSSITKQGVPAGTDAERWASCQALCCAAITAPPKCEAIILNDKTCFLLDRKVEGNFQPLPAGASSFVADLNCTVGQAPVCPPAPPPPVFRVAVNITSDCWAVATRPGALALDTNTLSMFENTGVFYNNNNNTSDEGPSPPREFYVDRIRKRVLISRTESSPPPPHSVVAGVLQTLLDVRGQHDAEFHNLTFAHSGWEAPSTKGIVERYGGTLFKLPPPAPGSSSSCPLEPSPAAVMVSNASRVRFHGCSFAHLGAWGVRLYDGTQDTTITACSFTDLSGGGICLGNVNDTAEVDAGRQLASITVEDNTLVDVGREYKGSPGIHSFCMRDSSISHNLVRGVPYAGLSFNWPLPQGPTFKPDKRGKLDQSGRRDRRNKPVKWDKRDKRDRLDDVNVGYSRNNVVNGNDVSEYMGYMLDGGGIHTIGRSLNTTVSRNWFHDVASGTSTCGGGGGGGINGGGTSDTTRAHTSTVAGTQPCHSLKSQSTIYIDNWSEGFTIDENVVSDAPHVIQGWIFFQFFKAQAASGGAAAHDNTARNNTICNAGPVPPPRDPWDEPTGENVTGTANVTDCRALPPAAAEVARQAGPRPASRADGRGY
jgi:hypothetical protein